MMITSFFLPHHMPFMLMPSKPVYNASNFENVINTTIIRFYRDFTTTHKLLYPAWILQITGQWQGNIPYGMPL